jgi:hypothetical protein
MPYDARIFHILIASPSDVADERQAITDLIHEWNAVNSRERRVVLLPLRWETHASPELGSDPQTVINRQVADHCDMVVGVFWTRLGTPTPRAESGTAEEMSRAAAAGKPIMLYFSRSKVDLEAVDLDEYAKLKDFKKRTYPTGLIEKYGSLAEFREKFTRQLSQKILDLIAADATQQGPDLDTARDGWNGSLISLAFAHGDPPQVLAAPFALRLQRLVCINEQEIPDYSPTPDSDATHSTSDMRIGVPSTSDPDYYRNLVQFYCNWNVYLPLRLAVQASLDKGVRDLFLEARISSRSGHAHLASVSPELTKPRPIRYPRSRFLIGDDLAVWEPDTIATGGLSPFGRDLQLTAGDTGNWQIALELPLVHAGRTIFSGNEFYLTTLASDVLTFDTTVYSSDSTPFSIVFTLEIEVVSHEHTYQQILQDNGIPYDS